MYSNLQEILKSKTADELRFICGDFNIEIKRSAKKAELIELLSSYLSSQEALDSFYISLSNEEIAEFTNLLSGSACVKDDNLIVFDICGYIKLNDKSVKISSTIADYMSNPHNSLESKRKSFNLIYNYFHAFANLYGIVPLKTAVDLFNKYEHKKLSKRNIDEFKIQFSVKSKNFAVMPDLFIVNSEVFYLGEDFYEELLDAQSHKSFAVLSKEEILKYVDANYIEITPQYRKMVAFLSFKLHISKIDAEELAGEIHYMCGAQVDADFIFEHLEKLDVNFDSEEQFEEFVSLYMELSNNTRSWENCGNTPKELRQKLSLH